MHSQYGFEGELVRVLDGPVTIEHHDDELVERIPSQGRSEVKELGSSLLDMAARDSGPSPVFETQVIGTRCLDDGSAGAARGPFECSLMSQRAHIT
jgi:hypothetical protein